MRAFFLPAGAVVCLLGSLTSAAGQARPGAPAASSGPPGIVHVFVTGGDGQPISDLLPEEVSVKVAGRVRDVRSLNLFKAASGGVSVVPEPYATNRPPADGRDVLIVVDNESFGTGRETLVRGAMGDVMAFVAPGDRLGLVTVPKGAYRLAPTTDHSRVKSAMSEMISRGLNTEAASDVACRTKATLDTLRQLVSGVEPERLTVVFFVSGGLTPPTAVESIQRGTGAVTTCDLRTDDYTQTVSAIRSAPVDFHGAFVPEDMSSGAMASSSLVTGLEHIAGATGNPLVRLSGTDRAAIGLLARRVASFYTIRFDAAAEDRSGEAQRLDVKVTRAGATVRARQGIILAKPVAPTKAEKPPSPDDLLRVATTCADLPLKAAAFPARGDDRNAIKVVTLFEPFESEGGFGAAAAALYDEKGRMAAKGSARSGDLARRPVVMGMQVKPGTYRLRVAATDAAGRCGTVDQTVSLGLPQTGPLSFSSLVLGAATGGRFAPVLEFSNAGSAIAYLEVYGVSPEARLDAVYELAQSADGPAIATLPVDVRTGASPDLRIVLGEISLAVLPPGDIVVRAVVGMRGQPPATISRTLRRR